MIPMTDLEGRLMDCAEWRESILHNCLESDTCVIYDRGAAWCEFFPNRIRFCNYEDCPRRIHAEMEIGRALIKMIERASFRSTMNRIDAGMEFVKEKYHSDDKEGCK